MNNILSKVVVTLALFTTLLSSSLQAGNAQGSAVPAPSRVSIADKKESIDYYKKQIQNYETLVVMYQSQFEGYKRNLKKTKTLLPKHWRLFSKSVTNLKKAIEFSEGMNLLASSYELEFKKKFPSYSTHSIEDKYKKLRLQARDDISNSLKLLGIDTQDIEDEAAILKQLEIFSKSSATQKSAIEVANRVALTQIDILNELQKMITTQEEIQREFLSVN